MPNQKVFKQRVRTRMNKTGESYTTARAQLLRKGSDPELSPGDEPSPGDAADQQVDATRTTDPALAANATDQPIEPAPTTGDDALLTSDESIVRATGRGSGDWFKLLDDWGASERRHPEIARWLMDEHGVDGWWAQNLTVSYERARGLRARHQMTTGFAIAVTRTVNVEADQLLAAFTDAEVRQRWLPDGTLEQRPTRAANAARFDWSEPPSRVVVTVVPRAPGKTTVALQHERLPDAETADRLKADWRDRLDGLKSLLESDG